MLHAWMPNFFFHVHVHLRVHVRVHARVHAVRAQRTALPPQAPAHCMCTACAHAYACAMRGLNWGLKQFEKTRSPALTSLTADNLTVRRIKASRGIPYTVCGLMAIAWSLDTPTS